MVQQSTQSLTRLLDLRGEQPFDHATTKTTSVMEFHGEIGLIALGAQSDVKRPVCVRAAIEFEPLEAQMRRIVDGANHPKPLRSREWSDLRPQLDLPCVGCSIQRFCPRHDRKPLRVAVKARNQRTNTLG